MIIRFRPCASQLGFERDAAVLRTLRGILEVAGVSSSTLSAVLACECCVGNALVDMHKSVSGAVTSIHSKNGGSGSGERR